MATEPASVSPVPEHLRTVTPRLLLAGTATAIEFYRAAFEAEEIGDRFVDADGRVIHAEIRIGDSVVMLSDDAGAGTPARDPSAVDGIVTAVLATYWPDVDVVWTRALAAGAEVIYPLADQFYGERGGRIRDPFGQQWMLSQRIEIVPPEELERRAAELFAADTGES